MNRILVIALALAALAACGKAQDDTAPLAFVPADTPYAYANIEPTPEAVTRQWSQHMQAYLPAAMAQYQTMLDRAQAESAEQKQALAVARALTQTLRTHADWDKLRELGFKPDMRVALYGVGLVPVLRVELGDPDKFRATVAQLESSSGTTLPVAKLGTQAYWHLGNDEVEGIVAVIGGQLVATLAPAKASDALKRSLLGLERPAKSLAQAGTLQEIAKRNNYSPHGEGFIDFVRVAERLTNPAQGGDREFAERLGLPVAGSDAACKSEYQSIARKFPRMVMGVEELSAQRVRIGALQEIEAPLAQRLAATLGSAPGTAATAQGIVDAALSIPVLKLKDFWIAQADAVAAKPFACASLQFLNASFAQFKAKIDVTVPPPLSDLTGLRFALDSFELPATPAGKPSGTGKTLMATTNPAAALAMAQLALPALKELHLAPDGKPVALPAGAVPVPGAPPLFAAMSDKAIAVAAGAGEDAGLSDFLAAPASSDAVFMRIAFTGKIYALMGNALQTARAMLPPEGQAQMDSQSAMFALYEKWIRSAQFTLTATAQGIALRETVEQNP